jgi:hypothetical protein
MVGSDGRRGRGRFKSEEKRGWGFDLMEVTG